ncbi:hypothetical protein NHF40_08745 [Maricaulaceae bacterium EIL42A08]|nr:hypothetical protein [Maricaulaceae bacterium EIL42A08]
MTEAAENKTIIKALVVPFAAVFAAMIGFALAREFGLLGMDAGKRGAAAMMGLMLCACGNVLPKIARRLELGREVAAAYASADRLAGWVLVLTGAAWAGIWVFAPIEAAPIGASLAGFGGFLFALGVWLAKARPTPNYSVPAVLLSTAIAGRATVFMLLACLFLAGSLFPIDAVWGDAVAQPIAIVFSFAIPALAIGIVVWARLRGGQSV